MKLAEDRVGPAIVKTAVESCKEAIEIEKQLSLNERFDGEVSTETRDADSPTPSSSSEEEYSITSDSLALYLPTVDITVTYDFGWDKRGNGFTYNSHSGRASVIGQKSNKILAFKVLSTYCAMCARGFKPDNHICVKNHVGSAKSMEPSAAVDLCLKNSDLDDAGVRVTGIVRDKDSSTIAALKRESPHPIQKFLDRNHNLKGVNNALWKMKKNQHPFLTEAIIEYIKRCVTYAIMQNLSDATKLKKGLFNISSHIFGEHADCNEDWCHAKNDPGYKYKHLPGCKPLSNVAFRTDLEAILKAEADNAEQLAHGGSTQKNESFNHMVNTRAPKTRHYSGSPALERRVASAVCQKNLGATHMEKTFAAVQLSPSVSKHRARLDKRHEYIGNYVSRPDIKKRRLFRKMKDTWKDSAASEAEGLTYVSGMGDTMERAADASKLSSWMPEPKPLLPCCVPVLVDIETTGFRVDDDIVQIAAKCGERQFNVFIVPRVNFQPDASRVTGMSLQEGSLFRNDQLLVTTPPLDAVKKCLNFLRECSSQILLVGHNFLRFDGPRLLKLFNEHGLAKDLCNLTYGLTDTIPLIRQGKIQKQDALAKLYLKGSQWDNLTAHDAMSDCRMLDGLLQNFAITNQDLIDNATPIRDFAEKCAANRRKKQNRPQFAAMKEFGVSDGMIGKMAGEGVTIQELVNEYTQHGRDGLEVCLGVQLAGKPRVTRCKAVLDKIERFLNSSKASTPRQPPCQ